jgi:hypothetical protein
MALTTCKECNGPISSEAKNCPHCGYPLQKTGNGPLRLLIVTVVVVVGIVAAFALYNWVSVQEIEKWDVVINEDEYLGIPITIDKAKDITISYQLKNGPNIDVYFIEENMYREWNNFLSDISYYRELSREETQSGNMNAKMPAGSYYLIFDNTDRGTLPPMNLYNDQVTFDYEIRLK